jgi:hypothetical protein
MGTSTGHHAASTPRQGDDGAIRPCSRGRAGRSLAAIDPRLALRRASGGNGPPGATPLLGAPLEDGMDGMTVLAIVVLLYGALCLALALFKAPAAIWNMGKIEGFKKLFGELGTQVFLGVWGVAGVALGVWLLVR